MYVDYIRVGMIDTNCYLLGDDSVNVCAVIDPGDNADDIEKMIKRSGMELKMILLTHGHFDHVTAVPEVLKKHPGIPVYLNERDYANAVSPNQFSNGIGDIPGWVKYDEGSVVELGNLKIEVLATPGHTPGSVTLKCENALFTGDTLFCSSCGRTDFPGGSVKDMMSSLKKLATLEGNYSVYPGHESLSNLDMERKYNSFITAALRR